LTRQYTVGLRSATALLLLYTPVFFAKKIKIKKNHFKSSELFDTTKCHASDDPSSK